jgi:type VI secretion system secreted protein Hcp
MALVDYFLKIDNIPGDSVDREFKDWIDIQSFSFGELIPAPDPGGGGGGGKVVMQDFHFTMYFNKASPVLFKVCATGQHIPRAMLVGRKTQEGNAQFYKVTFDDILVSSYQTSGASETVPTDSFSLNFAKIDYNGQAVDRGGLG